MSFQATKNIGIHKLDEFLEWLTKGSQDETTIQTAYQAVPWLFRGTELRAQSVGSLPFEILRGDDVVDSSDDYQNVLGFLPNPSAFLKRVEACLVLMGSSYWGLLSNRLAQTQGTLSELRYYYPPSIEPQIDKQLGLTSFARRVGGQSIPLGKEQVLYFWYPDPFVELGEPRSYPGQAALEASGVLQNIDKFASTFFRRGAIKATLLTVSGTTAEPERQRLKAWWSRMFEGIRNAWQTEVINADKVTPIVVGEGIKELENVTLTNDKRQDVCTALGIPQTKLFSDSASGLGGGGVSRQDDMRFYKETVVPEAEFIASIFNEQVLIPRGYSLQFRPETMDIFQEDENQRATSLSILVTAIKEPAADVAMDILGYDLTEEQRVKLEALWGEKEERAETLMANFQSPKPEPEENEDKPTEDEETKAFRNWYEKRSRNGKTPDISKFEFKILNSERRLALIRELSGAQSSVTDQPFRY